MELDRRSLFRVGAASLALSACRSKAAEEPPSTPWPAWPLSQPTTVGVGITGLPSEELVEVSITELLRRLQTGETTSVALVRAYAARIAALNETLHAVLEIDRDAETLAATLDAERHAGQLRGSLHGIPILVKDNIDTAGTLLTTAGSLALADAPAPRDAFVVTRLRAAGAIILGKANLSEWANLRGVQSVSGWSARGGQCRNPYALDRSPSGSSSGSASATAASLCAAALGSETDGSITSPASVCSLVGVKPTVGLVSRAGVIPISTSQDTVGPIARTVTDAALLLAAIEGPDPEDPVTTGVRASPEYSKHLQLYALKGARIGVPRKGWFGVLRPLDTVMTAALAKLTELGATLVDPVELEIPPALAAAESTVFLCELKPAMEAYLARRAHPKFRSLLDLIAFNLSHPDELRLFGQEFFDQAQARPGHADAGYAAAREQCLQIAREQLLDAAFKNNQLDAMVMVTGGLPWLIDSLTGDAIVGPNSTVLPAVAGYPHVTVPAGAFHGLPIGMSLIGLPYTEDKLLGYAYAYEQATMHRKPPRYLATAEL
jgi:amidase